MPDIKREKDTLATRPTDLPTKTPTRTPSDLPLPRHRPGEPIMYDPPAQGVEIFPIQFPNDTK